MSSELTRQAQAKDEANADFFGVLEKMQREKPLSGYLSTKKIRIFRELFHEATKALLDYEEAQECFLCEAARLTSVCVICDGFGCSTCEGEEE